MLLALSRESSLHSTVRLGWDEFSLDALDALLFTSSRSQKYYCLFLSSVLVTSVLVQGLITLVISAGLSDLPQYQFFYDSSIVGAA